MFAKKSSSFLTILTTLLVVIFAVIPATIKAQSWTPPEGPPPNNNAPAPIHKGILGQGKAGYGNDVDYTIGALNFLSDGLLTGWEIADGQGIAAHKFCLADTEGENGGFFGFPSSTDGLNCVDFSDGWASGGGGGDSLPNGSTWHEMLYWENDFGASGWKSLPGVRVLNPTTQVPDGFPTPQVSIEFGEIDEDPYSVPGSVSVTVEGAFKAKEQNGGGISVGLPDLALTGPFRYTPEYDLGTVTPGFVLTSGDEDGLLTWTDPANLGLGGGGGGGSSLPLGTSLGEILVWNPGNQAWEISQSGGLLDTIGFMTTKDFVVLNHEDCAEGNVFHAEPGLLVNSYNIECDPKIKTLNDGSVKILPTGEEPDTNASALLSYQHVLSASDSTGKLTYDNAIGMSGQAIVLDSDIFIAAPPLASDSLEDNPNIRQLCYEVFNDGNGVIGLVVDCQEQAESGFEYALGVRRSHDSSGTPLFPGLADQSTIPADSIVNNRVRYEWEIPFGVNQIQLTACGAGGGGGGGSAARPDLSNRPSGAGGGGGAAGECTNQTLDVIGATHLEFLVGIGGRAGSRQTIHQLNNDGNNQIRPGTYALRDGDDGSSTIVKVLNNGSTLQTITLAGGSGGKRGWEYQHFNPLSITIDGNTINFATDIGGVGGVSGVWGDAGYDQQSCIQNGDIMSYNGSTGNDTEVIGENFDPSSINICTNIGYMTNIAGANGSFLGAPAGGDGQEISGSVPFNLNLSGNSDGASQAGSLIANSAHPYALWGSGGGGGGGASGGVTNPDVDNSGWVSNGTCGVYIEDVAQDDTDARCSIAGEGGAGGPGFVYVSW